LVSMPTNFRSLVPGGYFSATPFDRRIPVSIRCNNPGAINGAAWEKSYPGYVDTVETTPGNKTTIFEAPEFGVAVWWELLRRYAVAEVTTIGGIINRYGGGQDYSAYLAFVTRQTGFSARKEVALDNDAVLMAFGKAMFQYEAGRPTPLLEEQILYGLKVGRAKGREDRVVSPVLTDTTEERTLGSPPTPTIPSLPTSARNLTLDTREGVQAIQSVLINCGYLDPPAEGAFSP